LAIRRGGSRLGRTCGTHLPAEGELPEGQERLAWATPLNKEMAIRPSGRQRSKYIMTPEAIDSSFNFLSARFLSQIPEILALRCRKLCHPCRYARSAPPPDSAQLGRRFHQISRNHLTFSSLYFIMVEIVTEKTNAFTTRRSFIPHERNYFGGG
jgi:hypothetical protein